MLWSCGTWAAILLLLMTMPAFARFHTPFAEAASAAPIIIRARVEAIATNDAESASFQLKVLRTFVRSFAARQTAHNDLYPGKVITLVDSPTRYQMGHEYLILLSEKDTRFRAPNSCGSVASQEIILGLVPGFPCPARLLWTASEVEARLVQPSVCPEQGYSTLDRRSDPFGPPEVLTLDEAGPRGHSLALLGTLWLGLSLASVTFVILRQRRRARLAFLPRS